MNTFHFLRPEWLWGFIPLVGLLVLLAKQQATAQLWESVCDAHLLKYLLEGMSGKQSKTPIILVGLGWALALLALAGPVWSQLPQPVFRAQSALVLVLDVSRSMDAQDMSPSRLTRAKHKILDILHGRQEGQTALVVFAGESFVVSPLTNDARTMKTLTQTLETDLIPVQGSRPDLGLQKGNELLEQAGIPGGDLLLITDGRAEPRTVEVMNQIGSKGRTISILGVGTEEGAPIPEQGGFVKDETGAIVVSKLEAGSWHQAAQTVGGRFAPMTLDDQDLEYVLPSMDRPRISSTAASNLRMTNIWREEGPWLVVVLLAVVLPAFRRGWIGMLLCIVFLPQVSQASMWENLWERSDQKAMKALEQNDPKRAAVLFEQPDWKGIAHYRAGEYEQAAQIFSGMDSPESHYNRGNSLAKLGKYQESLASYQAALQQRPDYEDARHNLDLVKQLLEKQQSETAQGNESNPSDSPMGKNQQEKQGEQSGQHNQEQQAQQENQEPHSDQAALNEKEHEGEKNSRQSNKESTKEGNPSDEANPQQALEGEKKSSDPPRSRAQSSSGEEEKNTESTEQLASVSQTEEKGENQKSNQALQQWLRRIPDDPGGLLRRKFLLEHRRRVESGTAVDASGRSW